MANATLYDILVAVKADLSALSLKGMPPANIIIHKAITTKLRDLPAVRFPCIVIAPWGRETMPPAAGTNVRDDITYPVAIAMMASEATDNEQPGQRQTQNLNQYLTWRETIISSFHNQRLTTLCQQGFVQPLDIVDNTSWHQKNLWVSGLILNCTSRKTRG